MSETVKVRLPTNLGLKRCGDYIPGEVYEVEKAEAERLVNVKRFEIVEPSAEED